MINMPLSGKIKSACGAANSNGGCGEGQAGQGNERPPTGRMQVGKKGLGIESMQTGGMERGSRMKFPWKKITLIGGLCAAILLPTKTLAYNGVITGETISYGQYGSGQGTFYQKVEKEKIAGGLEHLKISKLRAAGWVDIHVLKLLPQSPGIGLQTLRSEVWQKKETLKEMADKNESLVFGAVNASYFNASGDYSEGQGLEYDKGLVHNDSLFRPGLFEDISGKLFVSHSQKLSVVAADTGEDLGILVGPANNFPGAQGASVYNNKVYADSKLLDSNGAYYKVKVRDEVIREIVPPYTLTQFAENEYSLVFSSAMTAYLEKLTVGRKIQIKTEAGIALDWLKLAIPGGGYVLQNGEFSTQGQLVQPDKRHPRTAIGVDAAKNILYLVVVDGRGSSIGATHYELAEYLKELGITDAVSMDGGGSSALVARNLGDLQVNVENTPPDNYQRKLINGLAIVSEEKTGQPVQLILSAERNKVFAGMPVKLALRAVDANHMPVAVAPEQVVWQVTGGDAVVQAGLFRAKTPGKVEVTAYFGNISSKVVIEVTGNPVDLRATPAVLEVEQGSKGRFQLLGTDVSGFVGEIPAESAEYRLEDETIGYFSEGFFIPSQKGGRSRVTITVGSRSTSGYIVAGKTIKTLPEMLERVVEYQFSGKAEGAVRMEQNFGYEDYNSLAFAYSFPYQAPSAEGAEMPKQRLEMRYTTPPMLNAEPENLSMAVFGSGNLLRLTMELQGSREETAQAVISEGVMWQGWKQLTIKLPENISYPVKILGFTLENQEEAQDQSGQIYLDDFSYVEKINYQPEVYRELPQDPLRKTFSRKADIAVFGATGGRNRILDSIVLQKVIHQLGEAAVGIYAGKTELPQTALREVDKVWQNSYMTYDLNKTRVIHLAAKNGSFKDADAEQFAKLSEDLSNTLVDNILIIADVHPLEEIKNKREAAAMHELLSRYAQSSGKNLYYIAATGYQTGAALKDGVRYIKTNGLWYQVKNDREIDLNRKFYDIQFYLEGNTLYYDVHNLYPLVE